MAQPGIIGEKEFVRLITTQDSFSVSDMQTIERLIERYPYCQAFYFIQTAALKRSKSEDFDAQIQRSAAISPNRESLFRYIEKPRELRAFLNPSTEKIESAVDNIYNDNAPETFTEDIDLNTSGESLAEPEIAEPVSNEITDESKLVEGTENEDSLEFNELESEPNIESDEDLSTDSVYDEISEAGTLGFLTNTLPEDTEEQDLQDAETEEDFAISQDIDAPDEEVETVVEQEDEIAEEEPVFEEIADIDSVAEAAAISVDEASDVEAVDKPVATAEEAEPEITEEEVFEEISEAPYLEEELVESESPLQDEEETEQSALGIEESIEDEQYAPVLEDISAVLVDEIETEIPSIETPEEEFSKPDIEFEAPVVSLDDLTSNLVSVAPVLAVVSVPNLGIEIETVIPDLDSPGFDSNLLKEELDCAPSMGKFHVEQVDEQPENETAPQPDYPEERLMLDSVAARDYFVFDRSVVDPLGTSIRENKEVKEPEPAPQALVVNTAVEPETFKVVAAESADKEAEEVSKYNDDTLPFSFRWWLHKTRKEHDSTYQPYIAKPGISGTSAPAAVSTDLNQQIIESIFHAQPELNTFPENVEVKYSISVKKREGDLIERFIKEEPHIKPPASDKLNTENKAKRSSEDSLDLVTETLAKIYIDQMLFHKAIDTYKKLSLKFPEKSTYFADQISDLQKKIN